MWWKLVGLLVFTAALVVAVIPIRTHAVIYGSANEPPSARSGFGEILDDMYLTPGTALLILFIVAMASFVASKILRGHW